ncbi:DUF3472 domain-containing protein [Pedobacter cryoconitis]|uniref:DUF5077 domain-containing protein n=1 Tax=Pedobacter cryoconitis TaxID=188932 RepID=A0A7X0MKD0_9SPHI|nr:DUF5077 domain-containing protein [Pedobacter cryoconitis]MBB6501931.1 hypothetical protein [Pedobacter cryoconitis]
MKTLVLSLSLIALLTGTACKKSIVESSSTGATGPKIAIALGGNAWVKKTAAANEVINANGLANWTSTASVTSIYFRTEKPGNVTLSLRMKVPSGKSTFKVSVGTSSITKSASNAAFDTVAIGNFNIPAKGYVKVDLQGLTKTGSYFGDVSDLIISGQPVTDSLSYVKDNIDQRFYWGRRGPSVHVNYTLPDAIKNNVEWFYNEINVPVGMDPVGSYFMSNGFGEGYFGIQVNSATERRVLFSLWSPFPTDDPSTIPDDKKIKLIKKGTGVTTGEFGNEGSGGQSYLIYPWTAGKTYAFLTRAQPDATTNKTVYTSYFKPADGNWILIASFERPATNTRLKSLYSFLENFNQDMGNIERRANYGNQWAVDTQGNWTEITAMKFTGDDIANRGYRKDVGGGVNGNQFFLRNGGFFSDATTLKQNFSRPSAGTPHPVIDFSQLP